MAVRALRKQQGLAQDILALHAGIDRAYMGKIERGEHMLSLLLIFRIAAALNCSTTVLMQGAEDNLEALRKGKRNEG